MNIIKVTLIFKQKTISVSLDIMNIQDQKSTYNKAQCYFLLASAIPRPTIPPMASTAPLATAIPIRPSFSMRLFIWRWNYMIIYMEFMFSKAVSKVEHLSFCDLNSVNCISLSWLFHHHQFATSSGQEWLREDVR